MITEDDLRRWRAVCAGASDGPWHAQYSDNRRSPIGTSICDQTHRDAEFISEARDAMPALLDEVARLRNEVAELRANIVLHTIAEAMRARAKDDAA